MPFPPPLLYSGFASVSLLYAPPELMTSKKRSGDFITLQESVTVTMSSWGSDASNNEFDIHHKVRSVAEHESSMAKGLVCGA